MNGCHSILMSLFREKVTNESENPLVRKMKLSLASASDQSNGLQSNEQ